MKNSKVGQATLFQSWGRPAQSISSRSTNSNKPEANKSQAHHDAVDLIELGDDDDDEELLAAAEGMFPFDNVTFEAKYCGDREVNANNITEKSDEVEMIPGFDVEAGNVWIYPTNYPIRNYQFDIVEKALFKNTLVTLPTGFGKTFIAAVIMYNFYRWYPQGKVIFMAPTKPLVAQQIEACFKIMGIPQSDTAEMTGNMSPNKRQSLWKTRRVFFLTPQVVQNDLIRGSCKAEEVVLLVADEAHKALGNHAYCQVVKEISGYNRNFRVLALSATPGDDLEAVQQVITNLLISHMELRSEESPDIQPYTHSRQVEKVVVSLGEDIAKVKSSYLKILEAIVGRLFCQRVLWNKDPQRVTKFMLLTARDQFRKRMNEQGRYDRNRLGQIEGDFAMCISLYHAYELLLQHGILSFYNFIKAIIDGTRGMARAKAEIIKHNEFTHLMDELREEIEPPMENSANDSLLFSQFSPRRRALMNVRKPSTTFKSHPKLLKLKEIVLEHFEKFQGESDENSTGVATRVMIFSQYRDSVNEIAALLSSHKPLVRVMSFIGQQTTGKSIRGLSQKEQLQVVQRFRQGGYNTLVATCVGEEGLDIGEVDLIVCFDAHASPIRLVQRMGRTGRKRDGRIVVLVTEGKEEQVYMKSQRSKKSIHKAVAQATKSFDLYSDNPRMVPQHIVPSVLKMEMTVGKFIGQSKGRKKGRPAEGADIKKFTSKTATTTSKKDNGLLTYEQLVYWQEHFQLPNHEAGLSPQLAITKKSKRSSAGSRKSIIQPSLTEWLPWQTTLQPVKAVAHSRRTEHFVELLEFTELHGGGGVDDESYDLEMMSFLNEEDIIKPGQKDGGEKISVLPENGGTVCEESEGRSKVTEKKGKKTRKKLEMEDGPDLQVGGKHQNKGENSVGDTSAKNSKISGTKLKKLSPKNKARWKAFLKQFDDQVDEDFQTDGMNVALGEDEDNEASNCLQAQAGDTLMGDLPDVGEHWELDKNPSEANHEGESVGDKKELEKMEDIRDGEGSDLSDAASDEMTSVFPSVTPQSQEIRPRFLPQKKKFSPTVDVVPSPPNLDALDKMSLSSESSELNDFNNDMEEIQRKYFGNLRRSGADLSRVCAENDPLEEPFLMADFLDTEVVESKAVKNGGEEEKAFVTLFPNTNKPYTDQAIQQKMHNLICANPNSRHDTDMVEEQDAVAAKKKIYTRKVSMSARGILKSSSSDLWSNVSEKGANDSDKEETEYAEDFFMDAADDDVLTDTTLPTDGNVHEKCAKDVKKRLGDEDLSPGSGHAREESYKKDNYAAKKCEATLGISERAGEQFCTAGSSVKMNHKISKSNGISGLRHFSTNERNSRNDGSENIFQVGIELHASSTVEVRTRGERSSSTTLHSGALIPDMSRNSGAAPLMATESLQIGKVDLGNKYQPVDSWKELPSLEMNEKSHMNALGRKVTVMNESGPVGDTVGENDGHNFGSNNGDSIGGNTANNPCRSPLPKKLKLSLKRTSPKDKRTLPMKTKDSGLSFHGRKSLNLNSSKTLSLISMNDNSCGMNIEKIVVNSSLRAMECSSSETSVKPSSKTSMALNGSSLDREEPLANSSNLRTENGNVVAVMESDDEDEDEGVIRPVGKAIFRRKKALSSPCSKEFRKPASPEKEKGNQRVVLSSCNPQLGSNSDDEFETDKSAPSRPDTGKAPSVTVRARKRNSLEIGGKQRSRKSVSPLSKKNNRFRKNLYLDDEAELSDSDINDFSSDEADNGDEEEDEMDSFIDDATLLTQRTPSAAKQRLASSPVDMMAVYRQSLRSPFGGALKFRTPLFHKQRNKYKMVYKRGNVDDDSQSEAEETYESESVLENEVESENENEVRMEHETEIESCQRNGQVCADASFEQSQIGRPVKLMKRKRILDNSIDGEVSPKLSKVNSLEEKPKPNTTQKRVTNQQRSCAFGKFSIEKNGNGKTFHTNSIKSFDVVAEKIEFQRSDSSLRRPAGGKGSMRKSGAYVDDWTNDVTDNDLLVALDDRDVRAPQSAKAKKNLLSDQFKSEALNGVEVAMDMTDNGVAMDMTDNGVDMDIKEVPDFSLGFDFLWEVVYANRGITENGDSSKDKSAILKKSNEISKDSFTKIKQFSNQSSAKWYQLPIDPQTRNKGFVEVVPRPASKQLVVPLNVTNSQICNDRTVTSGQRHTLKTPLTPQNKSLLRDGGQRPAVSTHAKLQVVTPSCQPNNVGPRPAISPLLTSSQKDKGKTVILVDAREISSSQVVSTLRLKHNIKAEVCPLTSCDYIVSNRMAVKRKTASDVASGANSQKLVECIRRMCDLYDRPCLIIEKDRVKPGETEKNFIKTKAYIFTLASVAQTHVKMIFSDSQEETARLLTDLAAVETKKGMEITASTTLNKEREQVFRVVASIPRVSYVAALNLCSSYNTLGEIVNSTPAELEKRTPGMSSPRAAEIHKYLRHKFNSNMISVKK